MSFGFPGVTRAPAAVGLAGFAAWALVAASAGRSLASTAMIARCTPGQLSVTLGGGGGNGGGAHAEDRIVTFTDASHGVCSLRGYPSLQMLDGSGRPLPTHVHDGGSLYFQTPPAHLVTLHPGERASFEVAWEERGESGGASCPTSSSVEVTPPEGAGQITVAWQLSPYARHATPPAGCGELHVSPVYPGAGVASLASEVERRAPSANRYRAWLDAERLLHGITLPSNSVVLEDEPAGDAGTLSHPALLIGVPDLIDVHSWWRVPAKPASVRAFLTTHSPRGTTREGSGHLLGSSGRHLDFSAPAIPGELQIRMLVIAVVPLAGGQTGIRADAEVRWTLPRPLSERIPAGVRSIHITHGHRGVGPSRSIRVTSATELRKISRILDRLPTVQPGIVGCVPVRPRPKTTFVFRGRGHGPALAKAEFPVDAEGACDDAMSLTIDGRRRTPLAGGSAALAKIGRVLGTKL